MQELLYAQETDIGRVRTKNEDFATSDVIPERDLALFVIADGLGGLARGEVASQTAVQEVQNFFKSVQSFKTNDWLRDAFQSAKVKIFNVNQPLHRSEWMATTLTTSFFHGSSLTIAHIGDCRVYQVRQGHLSCLTRDHALDRHTLTRTVGVDPDAEPDIYTIPLQTGDVYVQCSDGLHSMVHEADILDTIMRFSPQAGCDRLVRLANRSGGPDNITVQIVRVLG